MQTSKPKTSGGILSFFGSNTQKLAAKKESSEETTNSGSKSSKSAPQKSMDQRVIPLKKGLQNEDPWDVSKLTCVKEQVYKLTDISKIQTDEFDPIEDSPMNKD